MKDWLVPQNLESTSWKVLWWSGIVMTSHLIAVVGPSFANYHIPSKNSCILEYCQPVVPCWKDFASCSFICEVSSTRFFMTGLENIKDLVLSNTTSNLEISSNVVEVSIYPDKSSTLLYGFPFLPGGQILGKLPCKMIIGYICIPRWVSINSKKIFIREIIFSRSATVINS